MRSGEGVLGGVAHALGLVVADVLHAQQLEHLEEQLAHMGESHAAVVGLALDVPVIVGARNCTRLLKSGWTVMLDANRGIVCSATNKG